MKDYRLLELANHFFVKACTIDGIKGDSLFVVFSDDNKYADAYNRAMLLRVKLRG